METHIVLDLTAKLALILGAGIGAQWLGWRLQWPAIVLMSLAGLALGPLSGLLLGEPLIAPARDFGDFLRPAIALAVAVILFEGGLGLHFAEVRATSGAVIRLVLLGAPLGWLLGTGAVHYTTGLPWDLSALLGGILVVTGPTVIIPLLRQARLSARPASVLKWEGIINDPLGAVFAVLIFEFITLGMAIEPHEGGFGMAVILLLGAVITGMIVGIGAGYALAFSFRRGWVPEYLKAPLMLVMVMVVYVLAEQIAHETGLVAVTAFGVTLANIRFAAIEELRRFKEGIATLLVSALFVILTAGLSIEDLRALDWRVLGFVGVTLFVVRPLVVWISTFGTDLNWRETLLVGWIAPRGIVAVAVAGYFSAELVARGRADAAVLTPLIFAIVFATVLAHGFSIAPLARKLGLSHAGPEGLLLVGANPWSIALAKILGELGTPVVLADLSWQNLRPARLEGIKVFRGEVLSENAEEKLDHTQIDWLLSTSSNEAYNALVCVEFAPELGRHKVFQLSAHEETEDREHNITFTARGRTAMARGLTYNTLIRQYWQGWRFIAMTLDEDQTPDTVMQNLPQESIMVAERGSNGDLALLGPSRTPKGGEGSVLIVFAPKDSADKA
ncbi:MAG: sodium:proton exchanger [Robiginitomaculum sp.]|nr:MAG: sodium:proton exchanger [Robiginitomaculum sp.]